VKNRQLALTLALLRLAYQVANFVDKGLLVGRALVEALELTAR